ncbi:MAG: flagellin, partial [bacterium]
DQDIEIQAGGANLMIEALETTGFTDSGDTGDFKLRFSFDDGDTWTEQTFTKDAAGLGDTTTGIQLTDGVNSVNLSGTDAIQFNAGDKMLIALTDNESSDGSDADDITVTTEIADGAGNATQDSRTFRFIDGELDESSTELSVVQLDVQDGNWNVGTVTVDFGDNDVASGEVQFDIESGGVAGKDTELWKIDRFYDDDGNFILGDNGKMISVYNESGEKADIFIDAQNTIGEVAGKINNAIKDGLDMGTGVDNVDKNIATYVNEAMPGTDEALQGTIVVRSPEMSMAGQLYFSADEDLMNALSIVTINSPEVDPTEVTVRDAHTGDFIGSEKVANNVIKNVISGVDIEVDPNADISVEWNETNKEFVFNSAEGSLKEYLHIVDNAKDFQIGANANQTTASYIGEMTSRALGVDEVLVTDQATAQKAIGKIDDAIDTVSSERARIGSVINRLNYTINNLSVQEENAIAAESRIRDLDMAKEASNLTKNQILSQAAQAMLSQANNMTAGLLGLLQ